MPPSILLGADDGAAESPLAPGVRAPFEFIKLEVVRPWAAGARVLSRCVDEAEDSLADSGFVGCFKATENVNPRQFRYRK